MVARRRSFAARRGGPGPNRRWGSLPSGVTRVGGTTRGAAAVSADVTLPRYLHNTAAVDLEGFEATSDWTRTSAGGTITDDATNKLAGSQSVSFNVTDATGCKGWKAFVRDLSSYQKFSISFRNGNNASGSAAVRVNFWTNTAMNQGFQLTNSIPIMNQKGWQTVYLDKTDFTSFSGNWANIIRLEIVWVNGSVGQALAMDRLQAVDPIPFVCPIFHDGYDDVYSDAFPEFQSRNMRASAVINDAGSHTPGSANHVTTAQLREMLAAGWHIGNHSSTHPATPGTLTQGQWETELAACEAYITGTVGAPTEHAKAGHYPSPVAGQDFAAIMAGMAARSMTLCGAITTQSTDNCGQPFSEPLSLPARGFVGLSLAALQTKVDYAKVHGTTLMFWCHEVGAGKDITRADLGALLDYCKAQGVTVGTLLDLANLQTGAVTIPAQ